MLVLFENLTPVCMLLIEAFQSSISSCMSLHLTYCSQTAIHIPMVFNDRMPFKQLLIITYTQRVYR